MSFLSEKLSKLHPLEILVRGMFVFVGGLLYLFAAWQAFESVRVVATHDKATAEVIRSYAESSARFQTHRIEARFTTERGNHRTEISRSLVSYEPGDVIPIYYQMETAFRARLGGFWGLGLLRVMIGAFGSIFMFFALKPERKPQRP